MPSEKDRQCRDTEAIVTTNFCILQKRSVLKDTPFGTEIYKRALPVEYGMISLSFPEDIFLIAKTQSHLARNIKFYVGRT